VHNDFCGSKSGREAAFREIAPDCPKRFEETGEAD